MEVVVEGPAAGHQGQPYDGQIRTVVEERINDKEQRVRVTRKFRMKLIRHTVDADVAARKQWRKYGDSKDDPPGPVLSTTVIGEPVYLSLSATRDHDRDSSSTAAAQKSPAVDAKTVTCRYCQGAHWSVKCPLRASLAEEADTREREQIAAIAAAKAASGTAAGADRPGSSKYVPPSLRGKEGAAREEVLASRPDTYPVRITNLSDLTTDQDLRDLCSRFGQVARVFISKDDRTGRCRGFGFVNFTDLEPAERCIAKLNGYTYGSMILKAEMGQARL